MLVRTILFIGFLRGSKIIKNTEKVIQKNKKLLNLCKWESKGISKEDFKYNKEKSLGFRKEVILS